MVPMRDGVHLATHVYFPARDGEQIPGSHPVVLNRTPYRKEDTEEAAGYNRFFARRSYIAVVQDCRGTFKSEGDVDFGRIRHARVDRSAALVERKSRLVGNLVEWLDTNRHGGARSHEPGLHGPEHEWRHRPREFSSTRRHARAEIQSSADGGTMNAARAAERLGKPLFCLEPPTASAPQFTGNTELLQSGRASPITSWRLRRADSISGH